MLAAAFASLIGWTLGCLLLGLVLCMVGTRTLSELRIWWARQTGRGSCRFCGRPLTLRGRRAAADTRRVLRGLRMVRT